ncbi:antibiotic biosynthesis monooxygenase [Ensifer sp. LC163]|uniref:antibiotic biosynthesis monooxygenase n=1 Tax=Ensifer sp. LC163 TaxID=1120652 RepID=UPI0008134A5E|nr:antibiotic biosynthesis monooxygenase [Ensifer sp. LC163]OCP38739.1 cyclase [Ensifer sp. LC163]
MTTLFVRHEVSDYAAWRRVYDAFSPMQKANGVLAEAVYQAADNPNDVTVTHEFATLEAAQAFGKLDELKAAMRQGGVLGTPAVWFANKA